MFFATQKPVQGRKTCGKHLRLTPKQYILHVIFLSWRDFPWGVGFCAGEVKWSGALKPWKRSLHLIQLFSTAKTKKFILPGWDCNPLDGGYFLSSFGMISSARTCRPRRKNWNSAAGKLKPEPAESLPDVSSSCGCSSYNHRVTCNSTLQWLFPHHSQNSHKTHCARVSRKT